MNEPKIEFSNRFIVDRKTDEILWKYPLELSRKEEIDRENFALIDKFLYPDETILLTWTGYIVKKMDGEIIIYEYCAFAMTEFELYIGVDGASNAYVVRESMTSCLEYCCGDAQNSFGMPWFVFHCRDDIKFYCWPEDDVGASIICELEARNIPLS